MDIQSKLDVLIKRKSTTENGSGDSSAFEDEPLKPTKRTPEPTIIQQVNQIMKSTPAETEMINFYTTTPSAHEGLTARPVNESPVSRANQQMKGKELPPELLETFIFAPIARWYWSYAATEGKKPNESTLKNYKSDMTQIARAL